MIKENKWTLDFPDALGLHWACAMIGLGSGRAYLI